MTVQVTSVIPQRAHGTATITINGTGFGPNLAANDVLINGSSTPLVSANSTQIVFTLPFIFTIGILEDIFALGQVINLNNNESAYFRFRVKFFNPDDAADHVHIRADPGPSELLGPDTDRPRFAEAKDWERLVALYDSFSRDVAAGQVLTADGTGLAEAGGTPGSGALLLVDLAEPTDLRWSGEQDTMLPFGGQAAIAATLLVADGDQTQVAAAGETEQWAPLAGTIDIAWLLVKSGGPTLDRVRILVNTVSVFDSGAGLGLGNNAVFNPAPAVAVAKGDIIELEATALGGNVNVVGGLRLVPS